QNSEKNQLFHPEVFVSYKKIKKNIISAGIDYRYMQFTRTAVAEYNQFAWGAFLQNETDLDQITIYSAVRLDNTENNEPVLSPKLTILYSPFSKIRIRAGVSRGYHAPTIQELYEEGYGHSGRAYRFGNPDLEAEYSFNSNLSIEYVPTSNLQVFAYAYKSNITNMITPVYSGIWAENPDTSTVIDKWVRTNVHKAEIWGMELAVRYKPLEKLKIEIGYNYSDNQNSSTGTPLPYYPGQSLFAKVNYGIKISNKISATSFVSLRSVKDRAAWNWKPASGESFDNSNGLITELADYQMLNAGIKVVINSKTEFYLKASNLLSQNIEKLDDALMVIVGEPVYSYGLILNF
ncbi:MAG: TonB-dependent receptor, partial [Bacteroidales bacterium]|nr:TonB-dependent receptor [Bacteroidales bacterium]